MTNIIIDHRECKLKELLTSENIEKYNISFQNLELGDIIIYYKNDPLFIFERKTLQDLKASIIDGRYKNQKINILQKYGNTIFKYIFEFPFKDFNGLDKQVKGALVNTILRDKVSIIHTSSIKDTFEFLLNIFERIYLDPEKYCTQPYCISEQQGVRVKKESTYTNMLCQIPSISLKTATAIAKEYPNMNLLIEALKDKNYEQKLNILKNITTLDNKGKARKLTSSAINNLIDTLFDNKNNEHCCSTI
jgi:ERCC4-type nuclease